jgi:hypothetical protein
MVNQEEEEAPPVVAQESEIKIPEEPTAQELKEIELVPDEIEQALRAIYLECKGEDQSVRLRYLSIWRQLQLYAKGIFDLYWDDTARDWRSFSQDDDEDSDQYNRNINIFRAHMESVVSALSVKLPGTEFYPDDADNPLDLETAEGMSDVVHLIQRHNKSSLLLVKALYLFWTQGTVAAYNYYRTSPKFGTISIPQKEQQEIINNKTFCLNCGYLIATLKETKVTEPIKCPYCGTVDVPETVEEPESIERIVGYNEEPKGREAFSFWGPINVKIPLHTRTQEDAGYLIFENDLHYAMIKSTFPEDEEHISEGSPSSDAYERYFRLLPEYVGNIPKFLNTVSTIWIRPWMYWSCKEESTRDYLYENFPDGCAYIYAGEKLVAVENKCLDDNWTISVDPLSEFIHGEPLGKPLAPVQEMRNDLVSLAFQSIEYSIPENFADPKVMDFQKYKEQQALPGMFTPVIKAPQSGSLSDSFFQTTPSRLSEEVQVFGENLDRDGQFVTHDFPSVSGAPGEGSKTAFEYAKSNTAALQALGLTWKRVVDLWINTMAKAAVEFVEHMKEDERYVKKDSGKFINVWIRKQNLGGKFGSVEPENNESLPQSWEQKWQLITSLLQMKDPAIAAVLLAPENAEFMKQASGMQEFYIPGDNDRRKQLGEIYDLINEDQSIGVDNDVDDHPVHMRIIKQYLTSSMGVYLYKTNPKAYSAIINHYKQHEQAQFLNTQVHSGTAPAGQSPPTSAPNIPS